jgi:hypothetical protein
MAAVPTRSEDAQQGDDRQKCEARSPRHERRTGERLRPKTRFSGKPERCGAREENRREVPNEQNSKTRGYTPGVAANCLRAPLAQRGPALQRGMCQNRYL